MNNDQLPQNNPQVVTVNKRPAPPSIMLMNIAGFDVSYHQDDMIWNHCWCPYSMVVWLDLCTETTWLGLCKD